MSRLAPVAPRKLIQVLWRNGLREERGGSKHSLIMIDPENRRRRTVIPDYSQISVDLLSKILREAGKRRDEYLQILREL